MADDCLLYPLCRYKWGLQLDMPPHTCKIEREEADGSMLLKQQPFETLEELYVPLTRVPRGEDATTTALQDERRLHMRL